MDYRWRDNIQRSSRPPPQKKISGRGKTATTLRLEKCEFRHALVADTFYTSPIRKNVRNHEGRHSGY